MLTPNGGGELAGARSAPASSSPGLEPQKLLVLQTNDALIPNHTSAEMIK
jgi:hypothetical protein